MDATLTGGTLSSPSSGLMSVYEDGVNTGQNVWITNRDSTITSIPAGTYVLATRIKTEYRPTRVAG